MFRIIIKSIVPNYVYKTDLKFKAELQERKLLWWKTLSTISTNYVFFADDGTIDEDIKQKLFMAHSQKNYRNKYHNKILKKVLIQCQKK